VTSSCFEFASLRSLTSGTCCAMLRHIGHACRQQCLALLPVADSSDADLACLPGNAHLCVLRCLSQLCMHAGHQAKPVSLSLAAQVHPRPWHPQFTLRRVHDWAWEYFLHLRKSCCLM
jgi:hypothetical protein